MPKDTRKADAPESPAQFKRRKFFGSNQYRKSLKDTIEMVRTYNEIAHENKAITPKQMEAIRYFSEPFSYENSRSESRNKAPEHPGKQHDNTYPKDVSVAEIAATPAIL